MKRILPSAKPWPLVARAATRRIEEAAIAALPPGALMQRAGAAVARLALAVAPHARRIGVVAGGGNNGGDGIEAAWRLHAAGKPVVVRLCAEAQRFPADAAASLARAQAAGVAIELAEAGRLFDRGDCDLLVDALLGIGASGAPKPAMAARIDQLNAAALPTLSIDLPSGLDADTGQPLGGPCVRASHTLALLALKPGLFTGRGRDFAGEVWFDSLDLDESALAVHAGCWLLGAPATKPARPHASHKGSYGDVGIVGGAESMSGAALLAARAAHAAGAGRVFVDLLGEPTLQVDGRRPELIFRPGLAVRDRGLLARMTIVVGCGGGAAVRGVLPALLSVPPRVVVDADALNAVASDDRLQALLRARAGRGHATILTPHPLEAARLLESDVAHVQADRVSAAKEIAERLRCVVVLKGSGSVIATAGHPAGINPTGSAALATAGTGDVLAGWIGGSWARTDRESDGEACAHAARVAAEAVWMHGAAADGRRLMRADDLVERLAAAC